MGLSPFMMTEIFKFSKNSDYNLRSGIHLETYSREHKIF